MGAVDSEKYSDSSHILKGQTIGFPSSYKRIVRKREESGLTPKFLAQVMEKIKFS